MFSSVFYRSFMEFWEALAWAWSTCLQWWRLATTLSLRGPWPQVGVGSGGQAYHSGKPRKYPHTSNIHGHPMILVWLVGGKDRICYLELFRALSYKAAVGQTYAWNNYLMKSMTKNLQISKFLQWVFAKLMICFIEFHILWYSRYYWV